VDLTIKKICESVATLYEMQKVDKSEHLKNFVHQKEISSRMTVRTGFVSLSITIKKVYKSIQNKTVYLTQKKEGYPLFPQPTAMNPSENNSKFLLLSFLVNLCGLVSLWQDFVIKPGNIFLKLRNRLKPPETATK
jgi:hypothetical protein